jgi:hypothetical protein
MFVNIYQRNSIKIRTVAQLLGSMTASFPGVMYGPLYFRQIELEKKKKKRKC